MEFFYYFPGIIAALFMGVGFFHGFRYRSLVKKCKKETAGTVIKFKVKELKSGKLLYPIIAYTLDGENYQSTYYFGSNEWNFVPGDRLTIRYNPKKPEEFLLERQESFFQQYSGPLFLCFGALMFILFYYKS